MKRTHLQKGWEKLDRDQAREIFFPDGEEIPLVKQLVPKERQLLRLAIDHPGFTSSYFTNENTFRVIKTRLNNKIMSAHLQGDPSLSVPVELFGVGSKWKKYYLGKPNRHRIEDVKQRLFKDEGTHLASRVG